MRDHLQNQTMCMFMVSDAKTRLGQKTEKGSTINKTVTLNVNITKTEMKTIKTQ